MNESEDELHDGSRQQDVPTKTAEIEKPSPKFYRHPNSRKAALYEESGGFAFCIEILGWLWYNEQNGPIICLIYRNLYYFIL